MIKVNNESNRTTSTTLFCCFFVNFNHTHSTPFSSVSAVDFEQVNVN